MFSGPENTSSVSLCVSVKTCSRDVILKCFLLSLGKTVGLVGCAPVSPGMMASVFRTAQKAGEEAASGGMNSDLCGSVGYQLSQRPKKGKSLQWIPLVEDVVVICSSLLINTQGSGSDSGG